MLQTKRISNEALELRGEVIDVIVNMAVKSGDTFENAENLVKNNIGPINAVCQRAVDKPELFKGETLLRLMVSMKNNGSLKADIMLMATAAVINTKFFEAL